MWFDDPIDKELQRLSGRFFNTTGFLEDNWFGNRLQTVGPYFYGYEMRLGTDGRPVVKEYGNVSPSLTSTLDTKQPYVEEVLDQENKTLKLVAEMPGVEKSDINVTIEENSVRIKSKNGERKYETLIPIKYKIDENTSKAKYTNGILELTFKIAQEKPKGKTVSVQ